MPYKYFNIEFNHVEQLSDLRFPINIFLKYVDEISDRISGYNFNKYYQPPTSPHPSLSIRFNTEEPESVKEAILQLSIKLLDNGEIRSYDKEITDWTEPDFVVKAHELGTLCALDFKNRIERNSEIYETFQNKPREFMVFYVKFMLRSIGFNINIIWSLSRLSPIQESEVSEMVNSCSEIFNANLGDTEVTPDFLERFIHAFFNCTHTPAESVFKSWRAESEFWKNIVESRARATRA